MAAAKAEAAHNRRHYRAAMLELSEIKKDLQAKEDLVKALRSEAHKLQYVHSSQQGSVRSRSTPRHSRSNLYFAGLKMSSTLTRFPGSRRSWPRLIRSSKSSRNTWTRSFPSSRSPTRRSGVQLKSFTKMKALFTCSSVGSCRATSSCLMHLV